jgi:hypothetical protein
LNDPVNYYDDEGAFPRFNEVNKRLKWRIDDGKSDSEHLIVIYDNEEYQRHRNPKTRLNRHGKDKTDIPKKAIEKLKTIKRIPSDYFKKVLNNYKLPNLFWLPLKSEKILDLIWLPINTPKITNIIWSPSGVSIFNGLIVDEYVNVDFGIPIFQLPEVNMIGSIFLMVLILLLIPGPQPI